MTIRRRLTLSFVVLFALFALNVGIYFWGTAKRSQALEDAQRATERQFHAVHLRQALGNLRRMVSLTMQTSDGAAPLADGVLQSFEDGVRVARVQLQELLNRTQRPDAGRLNTIQRATDDLVSSWQNFLQSFGRNQTAAVTEQVRAEALARLVVDQLIPQLERSEQESAQAARAASYQVARFTNRTSVAIFLVSGLVAALVALLISRKIGHGFGQLMAGADKIGGGELAHRIELSGDDECGELAQRFNRMAESLDRTNQVLHERTRELELFFRLVDQSEDILLVLRLSDGRLVEANVAVALLGYDKSELVGQDFREHPAFFDAEHSWPRFVEALQHGRATHLEWPLRHKSGGGFPAELSARQVALDDARYIVAVARDITRRKQLEEQLRALSRTDELTRLLNRRAFDERLAMEWRRAVRSGRPLSLLFVDVDCFKPFNDTLGHPAGDVCLRRVTQAMAGIVRHEVDALARRGGDEFAVLLAETDEEAARDVAERLRLAVLQLGHRHPASPVSEWVTVSIGLATMLARPELPPERLLARADEALYRAKRNGRNCVQCAPAGG